MKTVCILGGGGFVGSHLSARLAEKHYAVRVVSRHPERRRGLRVLPSVTVCQADLFNASELNKALKGCDAVINLVGILNESGRNGSGFEQAHVGVPRRIVDACYSNNIKRVLHMSALNADEKQGGSYYLRSKGAGENLLHGAEKLQVSSFRPSLIFGQGDGFFNAVSLQLRLSPCCLPLPCAEARFAPVWVGDVVEVMLRSLEDPDTVGKRYDLCGPRVYTLRALVEYCAAAMGLKRRVIPLPGGVSRILGGIMDYLPLKPFSSDNYRSLQNDSICKEDGFSYFGISPHSLESIAPKYLGSVNPRSVYHGFRRDAGREA